MSATLTAPTVSQLSPKQVTMRRRMLSSLTWRFFTTRKLPTLGWWGVKVTELSAEECVTTMPYGWRTQNPFSSTYFAAQCGAAELSTGGLALLHLADESKTSMLVTRFDSQYFKKVTAKLRFVCSDGDAIKKAIAATGDGKGHTVVATSRAYLPDGELASEFEVTWSFRRKQVS